MLFFRKKIQDECGLIASEFSSTLLGELGAHLKEKVFPFQLASRLTTTEEEVFAN